MRTFNMILNGARGGQGTSTVAAALALYAAGRAPTQLVAPDAAAMAALLGLPETSGEETQVADRLTLGAKSSGEPVVRVIDAGTGTEPANVECDLRLVVLRGPCYVALRSLVHGGRTPAGLIVLQEPGRSLSERDVHDVTGVPVVATIAVTATVARTVDAGLFIARLDRLRDFAQLRRYATGLLDLHAALSEPQDNSTAPISTTVVDGSTRASDTLSNVGTDSPVPPCGTGRSRKAGSRTAACLESELAVDHRSGLDDGVCVPYSTAHSRILALKRVARDYKAIHGAGVICRSIDRKQTRGVAEPDESHGGPAASEVVPWSTSTPAARDVSTQKRSDAAAPAVTRSAGSCRKLNAASSCLG